MLFNSYTFLIFFAIVFALHMMPFSWRVKKLNLLLGSYVFYAAWNPPFVALLWISSVVDWYLAKWMYVAASKAKKKLLLYASLGVNLGMLGFFKYANFFNENFTALMQGMGMDYVPPEWNIVLPVGISFFTFQTLSYTFDVYRGQLKPWHSFLDYAMYVTFFPQLVAGPIVRAADFLPQCLEASKVTLQRFGWGISLFVIGMFSKVVIADGFMAPIVDKVYLGSTDPTFLEAWLGTFAFAIQIFGDFAGYSTSAIGIALCFGFILPDNFRFPYAAVGFSDFWRRWHISLSSWLRDYLYISLGGNRKGRIRTQINLMITMLLGGLWHGASWNFVIWGALHGGYLVGERWVKAIIPPHRIWAAWPLQMLLAGLTFLLVCIAWVFFRSTTLDQSLSFIQIMFSPNGNLLDGALLEKIDMALVVLMTGVILTFQWTFRHKTIECAAGQLPWWLRGLVLAGLAIAITLMPGDDRAFIYFQF